MVDNASLILHQDFGIMEDSIDGEPSQIDSKYYDDDGHPKRTGAN